MVVKSVIYVSFQGFEGKHLFLKIEHDFNLLRTLRRKNGSFSQIVFSRVQTTKIRASKEIFRWKKFLFRKSFLFLLSSLEFEWFLCLFAKLFSLVCQTTDQRRERKTLGKINLRKICFSFYKKSILDFEQKQLGLLAKR